MPDTGYLMPDAGGRMPTLSVCDADGADAAAPHLESEFQPKAGEDAGAPGPTATELEPPRVPP
jgi:hypothetical protein